jgi:RimJ/RimL family protein N-acetyltransferase
MQPATTHPTPPAAPAVDVPLRDGSAIRVRPVRTSDREALSAFLGGLSANARYLRFFSASADVALQARAAAAVDRDTGYGLVALAGEPPRIVGHAEYLNEGDGRAEVAFEVAGEWQGRGIATVLLSHLSADGLNHGIASFDATVLPANRRMIGVFRDSGFTVRPSAGLGEIAFERPTALGSHTPGVAYAGSHL